MVRATSHEFAVGQKVRFFPGGPDRFAPRRGGVFRVVRLLPEEANVRQYRITSEDDGHERVVREDQLSTV
jgi:hypothetical protein